MSHAISRPRLAIGSVMIVATALLAGCGPTPVTQTTTTRETTTYTPAPMPPPMSTTTTEEHIITPR